MHLAAAGSWPDTPGGRPRRPRHHHPLRPSPGNLDRQANYIAAAFIAGAASYEHVTPRDRERTGILTRMVDEGGRHDSSMPWTSHPFDRALSDSEHEVLDALLSANFLGSEQLRVQADSVRVSGRCDCPCPTIYLSVDEAVASAVTQDLVPVWAEVASSEGDSVLLFADGGRLSSLEYAWIDAPPVAFPPPEDLVIRVT